jgi:hypothetical protein
LKRSHQTTFASGHRLVRAGRWRSWVASCAAVALILPSVVFLPAASLGLESEAEHARHAAQHEPHDGAAEDSGLGLADVPGSPTHPVNHDCAPCQIIKYLATGVLPQGNVVLSPMALHHAAPSDGHRQPLAIVRVTVSPPIRAPPSTSL